MRSKLEEQCASLLTSNGIKFEYEPYRITLIEGTTLRNPCYERVGKVFKLNTIKQRAITYTPDFVGDGWIIETKGYEQESSKLKWKLFKILLDQKGINVMLFKPHTKSEILKCIEVIKTESKNQYVTNLCPA
jgi:hypothetical protein